MEQLLLNALNEFGIQINKNQIQQFMLYKKLLLEWNEKINLTAITDEREIILKHFVDSLSIGAVYNLKSNINVIDVGTGAGFPGVPLKILYPNINMTLLDSLNKRILFLNELINQLELKNIDCIHSRAEDGGRLYREKYDLCLSRAVANLAVLSEYCIPFVKVGGTFISLKGANVEEELSNSKMAIEKLGAKIEEIKLIDIPFSDIKHSIIIISKIRQTPIKYPRKAGVISKNPLQ